MNESDVDHQISEYVDLMYLFDQVARLSMCSIPSLKNETQ